MNFSQLQERVRAELLRRIERGTLSVSLLARLTGMGQGHVSNFLHGRRSTSMATLDRILAAVRLDVSDLMPARRESSAVLENQWGEAGRVALVSAAVAMHEPTPRVSSIQQVLALPAESLSGLLVRCARGRRQWERFVAVQISREEAQGMEPVIGAGSLVVLDRHYTSFQAYGEGVENLYGAIVGWGDGARLAMRYAQSEQGRVVLRRYQAGLPVEVLPIPPERTASDLIVGRVALVLNSGQG